MKNALILEITIQTCGSSSSLRSRLIFPLLLPLVPLCPPPHPPHILRHLCTLGGNLSALSPSIMCIHYSERNTNLSWDFISLV